MIKKIFYFFLFFSFGFLLKNSVNAYTIATYNGITMNEEFVYNKFIEINPNFDLNEFNLIYCLYRDLGITYKSNPKLICTAFREVDLDKISVAESYINISQSKGVPLIQFGYYPKNNTTKIDTNSSTAWGTYKIFGNNYKESDTSKSGVANFSTLKDSSIIYNNVLDFSKYGVNLNYDENLFSNNENFKKVCVNENTKFAITPTNGNYSEDGLYTDFIWFPYGLNNGLYKTQYDSSSEYFEGNVIIDTKDAQYENFYFSDIETINSFYNTDLPSDFEEAGYTDKYSYYGYNAYKFFIVYKDGLFRYPIYVFDNPSKTHISTSGNAHGGGGTRLDGDEEIEITTEYCFYIKKDFEVNEVNVDEWGDFYGTVISPDGNYDFNTSYNKENSDSGSFLSQPIKFISEMSGTITFLNANIYNLYMSMPLIVRTFIITALIILIVILIMKLGGYN